MLEVVRNLQLLTNECMNRLEEMDYDEIQRFLLGREQLISTLQHMQLSEREIAENREAIFQILEHDKAIIAKLESFKEEAGFEIAKISAAKNQRRAYEQNTPYDRVLFDNKK